uniref:VLRF1 domain-containing protein n=1 Tax=Rhodosorus marinus TaxID=101924 RepID=A0A7S3E9E0_9RHOD|mmetsp:Transcript_18688/g.75111  ORF Transcript_18688/g.75111 Transcript_18688/m.75111 type:complete len:647 (+) Transcript_18688:375-2315(+)
MKEKVKQKRVSIFSIDEASLGVGGVDGIAVETADGGEEDVEVKDFREEEGEESERVGIEGSAVCLTCDVRQFHDYREQREHFGTDWHRHNLRRKTRKRPPLAEAHFEKLADTLSISGSEDEDEEDREEEEFQRLEAIRRMPKLEYSLASGEYLSAWKAALPDNGSLSSLKNMKLTCVFLAGGGHFAGAVFGPKGKVLKHQTYHRYTSRKKQGGEQDFNEKASRAKSAGAQIRRYNMQLLRQEIRAVLKDWTNEIHSADLVFLHAPGKGTRETFLGYPDSPLKDVELRRIPFTTRRATLDEVKRVMSELTSVYLSSQSVVEVVPVPRKVLDLKKGDAATSRASSADNKQPAEKGTAHLKARAPKPQESDLLDEEIRVVREEAQIPEAVLQLFEACCIGDVDMAKRVLEIDRIDSKFPEGCRYRKDRKVDVDGTGLSPLEVAASLGHHELVLTILEFGGNPVEGSPYLRAPDKETRDTFRRFWALNPDRWDYAAGSIPSPLTSDMEAEREAKLREKRRKAKQKKKAKSKQEKAEAEAAQQAAEARAVWECVPKPKAVRNVAFTLSLSIALCHSVPTLASISLLWWLARRRLPEREKRAMALEGRLNLKTATCRWCGKSLVGITPFERLSFKYCSTTCVHAHREEIERS